MAADREVDARRLLCPLPLLRAASALSSLPAGSTVALVATDPGIVQDLPAWCRINGHPLLSLTRRDLPGGGGEWVGMIRKGG